MTDQDQALTAGPSKPAEVEIVDAAADASKAISFEKTFTVTWKNPETGRLNVGSFTARRPNIGTLGRIAVLRAKLNGGEKVDQDADFFHAMIADLHYIIVDAPDWWRPDEFYTASPLRHVWDHVGEWLKTFLARRVG